MDFCLSRFSDIAGGDRLNQRPRDECPTSVTLVPFIQTSLVENTDTSLGIAHQPAESLHQGRFMLGVSFVLTADHTVMGIRPSIPPFNNDKL